MLYKPSMLKLITMVSVSSECVSLLPVFLNRCTGTVRLCDPCVRVSRVCVPAPPGSVRFFTVRYFYRYSTDLQPCE